MEATIVSVGNELLSGQTLNSNLTYIAERLQSLGIFVREAYTIKDDESLIHKALSNVETPLVLFTGGLGPTRDDMTKESICRYYDLPLVKHEPTLEKIEKYFARSGRTMRKTNIKQAFFPDGADILVNNVGTAPGMILSIEDKTIVTLPGPPKEMMSMFEEVEKHLKPFGDADFYRDGFRLVGRGESELEADLEDFYPAHPEVEIASYANLGEIKYLFIAKDESKLEAALADFKRRMKKYIVGSFDETLEGNVVGALKAQGKVVSFAESCTGGMLTSRLVDVPGASSVMKESYILYSNEAKNRQLGVSPKLLEEYGAVSDQAVYEMAYRLGKKTSADLSISVSGIAGPKGGSEDKPVGTVYFGVHAGGVTKTFHRVFSGDRSMIRQRAVVHALYLLYKALVPDED